jgi:hypothetical protein
MEIKRGDGGLRTTYGITLGEALKACLALTVLLIVLRITRVIDWGVWWLMAPLWVPLASLLAFTFVFCALLGLGFIVHLARAEKEKRNG